MVGLAVDGNQAAVSPGAGFLGAAHPRSRAERRGDIRVPTQATAAWFRFRSATNPFQGDELHHAGHVMKLG
ncbi:hypothetical protein [Streptomyces sp. NPDC096132]|uniref:hypothetical protein n=1 Tax=Streptomyces sp. NPDC096132 TaxID=3366075 RepID=UPI003830C5C8